MMDELTDKVAEAMWNVHSNLQSIRPWDTAGDETREDYRIEARAAIAAVRAYDLQRTQHAIDAYMAGYDPDDYTHPLSLTVGPRHEKGGIQG